MTEETKIYSVFGTIALIGAIQACSSTPEKPPCDAATLATITATCTSEADCNAKLDERQSLCAQRIQGGD